MSLLLTLTKQTCLTNQTEKNGSNRWVPCYEIEVCILSKKEGYVINTIFPWGMVMGFAALATINFPVLTSAGNKKRSDKTASGICVSHTWDLKTHT